MRSAMAERPVPTSASAGAHFADSLYGDVLDRLSGAVHAVVGAAPTSPQAASIGISTGAPTGTYSPDAVSGRLVLDEAKLRSALDRDPNAVESLLAGGVAARVDAVVADVTGTNGVVAGRIRSENARIAAYQASADQLNVRLANHETTLRRQFTAMEQAVGQLRELQSRLPSLSGA
jgi:flagellar capping protein FliD